MEILSGLLGALIAIFFTELTRRLNRIELLNDKIFNERLQSYIDLYKAMSKKNFEINLLIYEYENFNLDKELFKHKVRNINLELTQYFDLNDFFFSEELVVHCVSIYFGLEEMTLEDKEIHKQRILESFSKAKEIIKDESGINRINIGHKKIIGYDHKSEIIDYLHKLKKERG